MKAIVKGLIIGLIIIAIGVAIIVATLGVNGWSLSRTMKCEMQTYTATEDNNALEIEIGSGSVTTQFYDGDTIVIEYPASDKFTTEIRETNGKLTFEMDRKWHSVWFYKIPETVIKLPQDKLLEIDIEIGAGGALLGNGTYSKISLDIGAGAFKSDSVQCSSLELDISAGSAQLNKIQTDSAKINISAGSASLGFTGEKSDYSIFSSVSAGSCNVSTQTGSTNKKIEVYVSAGSANFKFGV